MRGIAADARRRDDFRVAGVREAVAGRAVRSSPFRPLDVVRMARHLVHGELMGRLAAGVPDLVGARGRTGHEERTGCDQLPRRVAPARRRVDRRHGYVHVSDRVRAQVLLSAVLAV